jgi:CubicO group peptidase (beta-lactamase class C family)
MRRVVLFVLSILLVVSFRVPAGELARDQPNAVGLSQKTLDEVQPGLTKLVADNKIAGAVAVVARHGKVAYVTTVGYRDLAKKTPITEDTIFAIASMSKRITCVAAMIPISG